MTETVARVSLALIFVAGFAVGLLLGVMFG